MVPTTADITFSQRAFLFMLALATSSSSMQEEDEQVAFTKSNQRSSASRSTYDLGIGKNKPVVPRRNDGTSRAAVSHPQSVLEATRYWSDHEAVREYPAPIQSTEDMFATKPKKTLPVVNPTRQAHDVLTILGDSSISDDPLRHPQQLKSQPIMVPSTEQRGAQLDVNTVWVEMLIHSEQLKQQRQILATAAAAPN